MNVIEVIPIKKGIQSDTLSYFTSENIEVGSIVSVEVRKKKVKAIVVSKKNASQIKSEIKSANFALKKIDKVKSKRFFNSAYINAINEISTQCVGNTGSILSTLVPDYILENTDKFKVEIEKEKTKRTFERKIFSVSGSESDRYMHWRGLIRQEFAKKNSLFFLLPTIVEADNAYNILKKGVEKYAISFTGDLSKKEIIKRQNDMMKEDHPMVIVSTYGFLPFVREDTHSIIVEKERSRNYKIQRRPYPDIRDFVEIYSRNIDSDLYYADTDIRADTYYRKKMREIKEVNIFKNNDSQNVRIEIVDMRPVKSYIPGQNESKITDTAIVEKNEENKFKIISDLTKKTIEKCLNENKKMFIFSFRRGNSPITICEDCQNIVLCHNCKSPVVLHKDFFMCHRCGERRDAREYCATCNSWKLKAIGIGIDLVFETIKSEFKDVNIFKIDADSIKNEKDIKDIIENWHKSKNGILLGTEIAIQYIQEKVDYSIVIGIDSLFSLPDYKIEERILGILQNIKDRTDMEIIIETRKPDERIFKYFKEENIEEFQVKSLEERMALGYPPFKTIIKLTVSGKRNQITKEMENIKELLLPYEIDIFPAFTKNSKGEDVLHGVIKIENSEWPKEELVNRLKRLSPMVSVNINPDSLL